MDGNYEADQVEACLLRTICFKCLPSGEDVDGVKSFTIAFGRDAKNEVLQRIASRTNGRKFDGDPETNKAVYESISAEQ